MIRVVADPDGQSDRPKSVARRRFGLDAPLPADRRIVARALLRHLAEDRPMIVVLALKGEADEPSGPRLSLAAGVPDLLLLASGGRVVFVKIKTQAENLSRAHRAFADLCRQRTIPLIVVRSLPEAKKALDRLGL